MIATEVNRNKKLMEVRVKIFILNELFAKGNRILFQSSYCYRATYKGHFNRLNYNFVQKLSSDDLHSLQSLIVSLIQYFLLTEYIVIFVEQMTSMQIATLNII
jgi:hypothetical protein